MARRKSIPILLAIAVFAVNGFSQAAPPAPKQPDFSGKWQLEDDPGSQRVLEISHTSDRLVVTESFQHRKTPYSNKIELYTDRRGERNLKWIPGLEGPTEVRSETFWKKDKLVRRSRYSLEAKDSRRESVATISETDEYSLSKDGRTLTIKSISTVDDSSRLRYVTPPPGSGLPPRGENSSFSMRPAKRVFRRVD
jgi:hypothetical protein